jgi:hypothetical protein
MYFVPSSARCTEWICSDFRSIGQSLFWNKILIFHFHFFFPPVFCAACQCLKHFIGFSTLVTLKYLKSLHVSAWIGHPQVLIVVFKKIAVILLFFYFILFYFIILVTSRQGNNNNNLSMFKTLYSVLNTCHFKIFKITTCFGLNWPSSGVNSCFLRRLMLFYYFLFYFIILVTSRQGNNNNLSMFKTLCSVLNTCHFKIFKITTCFGLNWPSSGVNICFQEDCSFFPVMLVRPFVSRVCL